MKIFCTQALEEVLHKILPHLPQDSVAFGTTGGLVGRIEAGEAVDLLLITRPALDGLARRGLVEADSVTDIASSDVGIGVKQGVGRIDLSSADSLAKLLLAAGPVAYPDPAGGGASGVHFAKVLESLGIAEQVNRSAILVQAGGSAGPYVVKGQAGLAVQMVSELVPTPGIEIAGTLPGEFAKTIAFAAAGVAGAAHGQKALDVITALKTSAAGKLLEEAGLTPSI